MITYIVKRRLYASVRNPYKERLNEKLNNVEYSNEVPHDTPELDKKIKEANETPVYQNLEKDQNIKYNKINRALSKINRDRTVKNQNININKNTNINNPSKEKAAELDAQVRMSKMRQQSSSGGGVNSKLIEIQKTNPLKPLSMNGGN